MSSNFSVYIQAWPNKSQICKWFKFTNMHVLSQDRITLWLYLDPPEKIGIVSSGCSLASVSDSHSCDREYGPDRSMSCSCILSSSSLLILGPDVELPPVAPLSSPASRSFSLASPAPSGATDVIQTSSRKNRLYKRWSSCTAVSWIAILGHPVLSNVTFSIATWSHGYSLLTSHEDSLSIIILSPFNIYYHRNRKWLIHFTFILLYWKHGSAKGAKFYLIMFNHIKKE